MYLHISLIRPLKMEGPRSLQSWNMLSESEFLGVAWLVYLPADLVWKHVELEAGQPESYFV